MNAPVPVAAENEKAGRSALEGCASSEAAILLAPPGAHAVTHQAWVLGSAGRVAEFGLDEVGRGAWCGPVLAAAVWLPENHGLCAEGLKDSKRLTAKARERLAGRIREVALAWAWGAGSVAEIERVNISNATFLAMDRALGKLRGGLPEGVGFHLTVDGNRAPPVPSLVDAPYAIRTVVGGDDLIPEVMAAGVLAKVVRDALCTGLDTHWPGYGVAKHKGYGTAAHAAGLARLGPSAMHRAGFAPVARALAARLACAWASPLGLEAVRDSASG